MASTPPPLPSSSDDSDFDDDDFGCFKSSAPVANTNANSCEIPERSDTLSHSRNDHNEESITSKSESATQGSETDHSPVEPPQDLTISEKEAERNDIDSKPSDSNQAALESIDSDTKQAEYTVLSNLEEQDSKLDDSGEDEDNKTQPQHGNFNEAGNNVEHSVVENGNDELSKTSGSVPNEDYHDKKQNDIISTTNISPESGSEGDKEGDEDDFGDWSDFHDQSDNMQNNDSDNITNDRSESADWHIKSDDGEDKEDDDKEEDECGDWSDTQSAQPVIKDTKNIDTADHENVTGNTENDSEINVNHSNGEESKDDAQIQEPDNHVSDLEHSPQKATSDISSEPNETLEVDPHQHSLQDVNGDDDDDFGDFADFSSHQVLKTGNEDEENIPPLSFKTSSPGEMSLNENDVNNDIDAAGVDIHSDKPNEPVEMNNDIDAAGVDIHSDKPNEPVENVESNDDFDDDDWGFKSAETVGGDQGNDDFGNFGNADNENDEDWASFNEPFHPETSNDVDDFSDFSSSDLQAPTHPQNDSISSKAQDGASKVEKVIFLSFPSVESQPVKSFINENKEDCDTSSNKSNVDTSEMDALSSVIEMGLKVTPHAKEETWTIVREIRNKDPVVGTWGRLKDVNSSHALDYGWGSSHCCQEVFSTLHIDTKNVLFSQKKQAVPFYTSGLGILEPIRGGPTEKNQPSAQPTLLDTGKPEELKKVLDIPPVDFDWGSSGLTNPLKVFKTENFNSGLSSLEAFPDVLQKNTEPTKEISSEAKSILSKIPNLNFMRSNVLMFPIKD